MYSKRKEIEIPECLICHKVLTSKYHRQAHMVRQHSHEVSKEGKLVKASEVTSAHFNEEEKKSQNQRKKARAEMSARMAVARINGIVLGHNSGVDSGQSDGIEGLDKFGTNGPVVNESDQCHQPEQS